MYRDSLQKGLSFQAQSTYAPFFFRTIFREPITTRLIMHSSTNVKASSNAVDFLYSCDKVYRKQEVWFVLT